MIIPNWKYFTSLRVLKAYLCTQLSDSKTLNVHPLGTGTYTTSSLSTKTTTASDPPNICKVKPQQLQGGSLSSSSSSSSSSSFSQLGCVPPLLPQQQQTPQVYVSQSAAGKKQNKPQLFVFKVGSIEMFPCMFGVSLQLAFYGVDISGSNMGSLQVCH